MFSYIAGHISHSALGLLIALSLLLASCQSDQTNEQAPAPLTGGIAISAVWPGDPGYSSPLSGGGIQPMAPPGSVISIQVIISGDGMTTISRNFVVADNPTGAILTNIPAISGITVVLQGLDGAGDIIFAASVTGITVTVGETYTVPGTVSMIPYGITVSPATATIGENTTQAFTATLVSDDGNATDVTGSISWSSNPTSIATIDSFGVATGVLDGSATIAAFDTDLLLSGTADLTVTNVAPTGVAVTPSSDTVAAGLTTQLTATATYTGGGTQDVSDQATWDSDDLAAATVSATGLVTGVAAGGSIVTATFEGIPGTSTITVSNKILTSISVSPSDLTKPAGLTVQYTATAHYSDGSSQGASGEVWTSSDEGVATIDSSSGLLTTVGAGSTTLTATWAGESGSTTLTVTNVGISSISVSPISASVAPGATQQFSATADFTDGSSEDITDSASWSSLVESVATVNTTPGLALGILAGTTTIRASLLGANGDATLTVEASLLSIVVTPADPTVVAGNAQPFTATGTYTTGPDQDITTSVAWESSNDTAATIGAATGLADTVAEGSTTITATLSGVSANTTLTVSAAELVSVAVTPASQSIKEGETQQFTATGTYTDASTKDITTSVAWDSSIPAVASIDVATGLATGEAPGGPVTITADAGGGITDTADLTVTAATLTSVTVSPATPTIGDSDTVQFVATGNYDTGISEDITTLVAWDSSDLGVATIGLSTGLAAAVAAGGPITITADAGGGITDTASLTVTTATLLSIAITPASPSKIMIGATQLFVATGTYSSGSPQNITTQVTWNSASTGVAGIGASTGLAVGAGGGTSNITATLSGKTSNIVSLPVDDYVDVITGAQPIEGVLSSTAGHLLDSDKDMFEIKLGAPGSLALYTTSSIDTYGRLLSSGGGQLALNDTAGNDFVINYNVTAPGTYYGEVSGANTGVTGAYTLQSDFAAATGVTGNPTNFDDATLQGWSTSGLWHLSNKSPEGGSGYAAWYGQESTDDYNTGGVNSGELTFAPVLRLGNAATVRFDFINKTEGSTSYDKLSVETSTNGGSTWFEKGTYSASTSFTMGLANLNLAAGSNALVRFRFDTIDTIGNSTEGVHLDNIRLGGLAGSLDDFEDGNYTGWTLAAGSPMTPTVDTTFSADGSSRSLKIVGGGGHFNGLNMPLTPTSPNYFGFWVRSTSVSSSSGYVILRTGTLNVIFFFLRGNGKFYANGDTVKSFSANTWYFVEFKNMDWSAKDFDLFVDGSLVEASIGFQTSTATSISQIDLYNYNVTTAYWDEMVMESRENPMAYEPIVGEGFEDGNYSGWTLASGSTQTPSVVTTTAAEGTTRSLRMVGGNTSHYTGLSRTFTATAPSSVDFWVRSGSTSLADGYTVLRKGTSNVIFFYMRETGKFYANGEYTTTYSANTWYHIEFRNMNWSTRKFDLYADGALVQADISMQGTATNIDRIELYNFHSSTAYWDQIVGIPFTTISTISYTLGTRITPNKELFLKGIRYVGGEKLQVYNSSGTLLYSATVSTTITAAERWKTHLLPIPLQLQSGQTYTIAVFTGSSGSRGYYYGPKTFSSPDMTVDDGYYVSGEGYPTSFGSQDYQNVSPVYVK